MDEDIKEDDQGVRAVQNNWLEGKKAKFIPNVREFFAIFRVNSLWFNAFEASLFLFFIVISVFFDSFFDSFTFRISVFKWLIMFYIIYSIIFSIILRESPIYKILMLVVLSLALNIGLFYLSFLLGVFPYRGFDLEFGPFMFFASILLPIGIKLVDNFCVQKEVVGSKVEDLPDEKDFDESSLDKSIGNLNHDIPKISEVKDFEDIQLPLNVSGFSYYADKLVGSCGYILVDKDGIILSEKNFFENSQVKALILDSMSKMVGDSILRLEFGKLENMLLFNDQIGVMVFLLKNGAKFFVFFDSRLDKKVQFELFLESSNLASRLIFDII